MSRGFQGRPTRQGGLSVSSSAAKVTADLQSAVALHQRGLLVEAEQIYRSVLKRAPANFDAMHLLGVISLQRHQFVEAEQLIARALKISPKDPGALTNRGNALRGLGRRDDALVSFNKAIALKPDYAEAFYNQGVVLQELRRFEEALASYERAIALRPNYVEAFNNRGSTLKRLSRLDEALASYDKAIALKPDYVEALSNRGATLQELNRHDEALASYDRAIALKPSNVEVLTNRGVTLQELQRYDEALASYAKAIALKPDHVEALSNRGNTLRLLKRHDEALESYAKAIALKGDYAEAFYNRGVILEELNRPDEALASYEAAMACKPDYVEALYNRGVTLQGLTRFEEALASYERAIALKPDYAKARLNRSLLLLLKGNYADGWEDYEWRLKGGTKGLTTRKFEAPQWQGGDLAGKTILLYAEQGYGDTIQFCRYVPLVAERGARVILQVQAPLCELMSTLARTPVSTLVSLLGAAAQIVSADDLLPDFDVHYPLLSLPLALGTRLESIPSATPYLQAPTRALEPWRTRLGPRDRPRIGISWAGNSSFMGDATRSIGLLPMLPMLANKDVQFFSLQKDLRAGDAELLRNNPQVIQLGQEIETFADTAAIMSLMDIVISSDTSVVHLAGALGKPVWILLQFVPDWRWLLARDDSPWYPTARLFRQREARSWDDVIVRVDAAIRGAFPAGPGADGRDKPGRDSQAGARGK